MKKIFYILFTITITFSACKKEEMDMPTSFPQLQGSYTHSYYTSWQNGLYERSRYMSYDFDNTRKTWYYSNNWSYTESGWVNALKDSYSADLEWKIENGQFSSKLWDNEYSSWNSKSFEYIDSTDSFYLDGYLYIKD